MVVWLCVPFYIDIFVYHTMDSRAHRTAHQSAHQTAHQMLDPADEEELKQAVIRLIALVEAEKGHTKQTNKTTTSTIKNKKKSFTLTTQQYAKSVLDGTHIQSKSVRTGTHEGLCSIM